MFHLDALKFPQAAHDEFIVKVTNVANHNEMFLGDHVEVDRCCSERSSLTNSRVHGDSMEALQVAGIGRHRHNWISLHVRER